MALIPLKCPHCDSAEAVKYGSSAVGTQRYICRGKGCGRTFQHDYAYKGYDPRTRAEIYFLTVNGNGTRATARILGISADAVTAALRSFESDLWHVNREYLENLKGANPEIEIVSGTEAEMDEMWSFVHDKSQQYWLWWAVERKTGTPLAFHFGTRERENLDSPLALLKPFNVTQVYSDNNPAYASRIPEGTHVTGKRGTQKIERLRLSLRTWCSRLVRKGIRFSKRHDMRKIVVALVINFWFFSRTLA